MYFKQFIHDTQILKDNKKIFNNILLTYIKYIAIL